MKHKPLGEPAQGTFISINTLNILSMLLIYALQRGTHNGKKVHEQYSLMIKNMNLESNCLGEP